MESLKQQYQVIQTPLLQNELFFLRYFINYFKVTANTEYFEKIDIKVPDETFMHRNVPCNSNHITPIK